MPLKAAQLQQLKTEITTDPKGLGLAALGVNGSVGAVTERINTRYPDVLAYNAAAVQADYTVLEDAANTDLLRSALHPTDFVALTADQRAYFDFLTECAVVKVQPYHRTWVQANISNATIGGVPQNSRKRILDILDRDGSRAEALFGAGVAVLESEVIAALALP